MFSSTIELAAAIRAGQVSATEVLEALGRLAPSRNRQGALAVNRRIPPAAQLLTLEGVLAFLRREVQPPDISGLGQWSTIVCGAF